MEKQMIYKFIGEYKYFPSCRFCASNNVEPVINLGYVPLAGGFFKKETAQENFEKEKLYPLILHFCKDCYLLQVNCSISPDILFKNYFYFSSSIKTLVKHFETNVLELTTRMPDAKKRFIVEIGSNDGSFIESLLKNGYKALGVDPAENITKPLIQKGLPVINDYFSEKLAKKIVKKYGKADAIYSFHALAHIENMHDVAKGIKALLKQDGFLAFEVHYLGDLIQAIQYDMIYHEHQFYYSLLALQHFLAVYEMEIYDVKAVPVRAGSMMYFVQNKKYGKRKISQNVKLLSTKEKKQGLHKIQTYLAFSDRIQSTKRKLLQLLQAIKSKNQTIAGYGASGRGTIIMNYCNLTKDLLDFVIDDAPAKHGAYTPGTHHKIVPNTILYKKNKPDYTILFAWPFFEEVKKKNNEYLRNGGRFILPLPKIQIIS